MIALVILLVGFLCILIGRILLIGAAFSVSAGWGIGVLLPFGPLFFRLSYPELAPISRYFRLAGVVCIFGFFMMQPGLPSLTNRHRMATKSKIPTAPSNHHGVEKYVYGHPPNLEERRAANDREMPKATAERDALDASR